MSFRPGWVILDGLPIPKNKTEERKERRMDGRRKERRKGVREGKKNPHVSRSG